MSRAQVIIDGDVAPLRQVLREGLQSVQHFAGKTGSTLNSVGGATDLLRGKFALLVTTLTGGSFGYFIKESIDMMDHLDETSQKVGITTEALSELAYAAKFASLDTEDLTKMLARMSGTLQDAKEGQKEAVDIFRRLRLDPQNIKDADQLLMELADRFGRMPDGVAKTALAIDVFGEKLGPKMLPLLADGRIGLERLRQEAHDLGVVIDSETAASAARLNDQWDRVKTSAEGVWVTLASKLLPSLASLADMWALNVKQGGLFAGTLATIQERLKQGLGIDSLSRQEQILRQLTGRMGMLVNEIERLQNMVNEDPNAILDATVGPDGHGPMRAVDRIKQLRAEYERTQKVAAAFRQSVLDAADAMEGKKNWGGGRGGINPNTVTQEPFMPLAKASTTTSTKSAAKSQMDAQEAMLAKEKEVLIESGLIRQYEAAQELDFWKRKLQLANLSAEDRLKIERRVSQLSYEVKRQALEREQQLETMTREQIDAARLGDLDRQMAAAKVLLDNDQITKAQFLQLELNYEAQRYEIQRQALLDRLELLAQDPNSNPVEASRIKGELLEIERKYQLARMETMGQIGKDSPFGGVTDGIGTTIGSELDGLITKTRTWGQAAMSVFGQVRQNALNAIGGMAQGWITGLARMLAAKLGFLQQDQMAQAAGSDQVLAKKAAETLGVVQANAAQAGAGAAASQASIPYIGPALALAAMATVFGAVMALTSRKSAARGYDIPSGVNPVTQLHEEEMVLPAKYANGLRELIGSGMAGQGAGGGGPVYNYHAAPGESPATIRRNARIYAEEMQRLHRNGWRPA